MESIVQMVLWVIGGYLLIGIIFALAFVRKGVQKIDPTARDGASMGFRIAIIPATMVFWPLLAQRWARGCETPPEECSPHRCAACKGKNP